MPADPEAGTRSARDYARTLERALADLREGPVVFTHRDWDLANRWHARGIPVGVVLDALDAKRKRVPRGLGAVAAAVEESWQVVQAGKAGAVVTAPREDGDPIEPLRNALLRLAAGSDLHALVARAIEDPEHADRIVDDGIVEASDAADAATCDEIVDRDLAPYRDRMPPDRFRATRDRARVETLRRRYDIPRVEQP